MNPMRILVTAFAVLASTSLLAQNVQTPSCPTASGAYYQVDNEWKSMDATHSIGFKSTGVMKTAFSYGAAAAKLKAQFRDGKSPYQLKDGKLSFCLVGITDSGRDITLAKFQEEKDRRELQMASIRIWKGVNAQIDPKSVIATDVQKLADKTYLITSKEPLPEGEFILFTIVPDVAAMAKANTPSSLGGYDFGNHKGNVK